MLTIWFYEFLVYLRNLIVTTDKLKEGCLDVTGSIFSIEKEKIKEKKVINLF